MSKHIAGVGGGNESNSGGGRVGINKNNPNNSNNKMNSFRGGPVRATVNAIDSSTPLPPLTNFLGMPSTSIGSQNTAAGTGQSHIQRPSSSKPIMKNSFTEGENREGGPLS